MFVLRNGIRGLVGGIWWSTGSDGALGMAYPIMLGRGSQAGSHPAHWRAAQHTKHCWEHGGSRIASTPTKQGSTLRVPTSSISQEGHITATSEHKVLELTLELWRLHKAPGGHRAHSSVPPGPFGHPFPKGPGRAGPIYTTQCPHRATNTAPGEPSSLLHSTSVTCWEQTEGPSWLPSSSPHWLLVDLQLQVARALHRLLLGRVRRDEVGLVACDSSLVAFLTR